MITDRITALLADRGYDADAIRAEIAQAGVQAVIPAKRGRRSLSLHDRDKYHLRSRIAGEARRRTNIRRQIGRSHERTSAMWSLDQSFSPVKAG